MVHVLVNPWCACTRGVTYCSCPVCPYAHNSRQGRTLDYSPTEWTYTNNACIICAGSCSRQCDCAEGLHFSAFHLCCGGVIVMSYVITCCPYCMSLMHAVQVSFEIRCTFVFVSGYRIVGSHSGVKMCRWTKSMLRGRGGCYKHTFYGIESHRCMESTPSLACANKCVFCWR